MDQKFFGIPFAVSGDRAVVPQTDGSGFVNYTDGYGLDYSRNPETDVLAKRIEREGWNGITYDITNALSAIQKTGYPEWVTSADNGGVPFPYELGATVIYRALPADPWKVYRSLVTSNTFVPTDATKWKDVTVAVTEQELSSSVDLSKGASMIYGTSRVVNSIAELKTLLKTTPSQNAFVSGYYAEGDGGGGPYYLDSADTTSADNGGTIIVAADGGRWKLVNGGTVSINQFGAKGDWNGVSGSDDTAFIQAAFSSSAKRIIADAGKTYQITDTILLNANSKEIDFARATLHLNDVSGVKSHIKIGDGITQKTGNVVRRVVFSRQQIATAGYAIDTDYIGVTEIRDCRIFGDSKIWRGINLKRSIICLIQGNYIDNCVNRGLYLIGTDASANRTVDTTIINNRIEGGVTGIETSDFVEGFFMRNNILYNFTGVACAIDATTNANGLSSFKLQHNDFDTSLGGGLYIDKVNNIQVGGNWFASNNNFDIEVKEQTDSSVVTDNQMYPNAIGINIYGNACRFSNNLLSGGTTQVKINPTATRTDVSTNTISNAQNGVDLTTAANSYLIGNNIYGMSGSPILNAGGAGVVVKDNLGDQAVAVSGIAVGASPFTYTAGARPQTINIFGGTVSQVAIGAEVVATASNIAVSLSPYQAVTVTYSVAPQMKRNVL